MKQVIILCFLTLTLSLSKAADSLEKAKPPVVDANALKPNPTEAATVPSSTSHNETEGAPKPTTTLKSVSSETVPTSTPKTPQTKPTADTKENTTASSANGNKTVTENDTKVDKNTAAAGKPSTETASASTEPSHNETKTTVKNETSTVAPSVKPTDASKTTEPTAEDDKHVVQARGFDGPSFIGGIILTLGLLAIGFMGFKYYKNQTERNYHTL